MFAKIRMLLSIYGLMSDELAIEDWEAFNAGYQDYLTETVSHLDALSSHEFEPGLALLDQFIQSLVVDTP